MTSRTPDSTARTPHEAREYAIDFTHLVDFDFAGLPPETPLRLFIRHRGITVPVSLVLRGQVPAGEDDRLVILLNGAVDLERSQRQPVFQRLSWWPYIRSHVLAVCDPGTVGDDALPLAWSHASPWKWATPAIAEIVHVIADALGPLPSERRTYFGSSAGGHLALQLSIRDPGSRAVVNNCQFDWTRWYAPAVREVCVRRFERMSPQRIRDLFPNDISPLNAIREFGIAPRLDYWVNLSSKHDSAVELPQLIDLFRTRPELVQKISVHAYRDPERGHNPVDKQTALRMLGTDEEAAFASRDLGAIHVTPRDLSAESAAAALDELAQARTQ